MKKYLTIILSSIVMLFVVSCAKDATNNTGGGNNINTPTVDTSYQPSSAGSTWLYYTRDSIGTLKDSILVSSTGRDTTINTKQYVILNYDTTHQFQYHSGNQYAFRTTAYSFSTTMGNINLAGINIVYINNENDAVGTKWTFSCVDGNNVTVSAFTIPTQAIGTVKGVGLTDTENGVTYNNVFFSHIDFQALLPAFPPTTSYTTIQSMDIYASRKVGLIKIITYNQNNQVTTVQSLKSYTIK
ncbi:MAG: hypothetical protein WCP65_03950 [Bacteroidota bacterium]